MLLRILLHDRKSTQKKHDNKDDSFFIAYLFNEIYFAAITCLRYSVLWLHEPSHVLRDLEERGGRGSWRFIIFAFAPNNPYNFQTHLAAKHPRLKRRHENISG